MRPRRLPILLIAVTIVSGCSSNGAEPATSTRDTTTSTETTTTTAVPTTTTTTTTIVPSPSGGEPLPTLDDGRPSTWVGVTADYEAVEVDTAGGDVIRSLGQVSTAEDVETAECAACVNAIDAVWRTYDGSHILISECCEPAAGLIHVLTEDEIPLLPAGDREPWWASPRIVEGSLLMFLFSEVTLLRLWTGRLACRRGPVRRRPGSSSHKSCDDAGCCSGR
jgi:hypothetical protein